LIFAFCEIQLFLMLQQYSILQLKLNLMKRVTSITLTFIAILSFVGVFNVNAQQPCTPPQPTGEAGLSPDWTKLNCIYKNSSYSEVIEIENLSEVAGNNIDSLRLDSISVIAPSDTLDDIADYSGPPDGITYETSNGTPVNTWGPGETGCVSLSGTTNELSGNYQLGIWVTIWIDNLGKVSGEANDLAEQFGANADFSYYLKVRDQGDPCDSVYTGIRETSSSQGGNLTSSVSPNPFSQSSQLTVYTEDPAKYELTLHNMLGEEVRDRSLDLRHGENNFELQRGELSSGIYLMNLTSQEADQTISKRVVIGSN